MSLDINLTGVEATANKSTNVNTDQASNTKYPSVKAVFDWAVGLFVPTTRTINGQALSSNVTLTASDVGAPSGSGSSTGTNTGDETATSILDKLGIYILKSLTSGATVTGTAENIVGSFDVGSSKFSAEDNFNFNCDFVRGTRSGSCTLRAYLAPNSGNLTGAVQIALGTTNNNSVGYLPKFNRFLKIKGGNLEGFQFGRATNTQELVESTVSYASTPFDVTSTRYLIITSTFTSAGDTGYLNSMTIKNF